jgi:hypothetical protein
LRLAQMKTLPPVAAEDRANSKVSTSQDIAKARAAQERNLQALGILADWKDNLHKQKRRLHLRDELIGVSDVELAELEAEFDALARCMRARVEGRAMTSFPELDCLGSLSLLDYDKRRKDLAKQLGVGLKALDAHYKEQRKKRPQEGEAPRPHWTVEPWTKPVNGALLLDLILRRIKRHVIMSEHAALASALWVFFTWLHEAFVHSPLLLVSSPEPECGKSTLLGLISWMAPRGFIFVEIAGLARAQGLYRCGAPRRPQPRGRHHHPWRRPVLRRG